MVTKNDLVVQLSKKIEAAQITNDLYDRCYEGTQPLAWLSPEAVIQLKGRLSALTINYCRLAIDSLAERLSISGYTVDGEPAPQIWQAWDDSGMPDAHSMAHIEALTLGRSFAIVWADAFGSPVISVESAREVAAISHPLTREVTSAIKRWRDPEGTPHAVLFSPVDVSEFVGPFVPEGGELPTEGWKQISNTPHGLGVVPVVQFLNRGRILETDGVSEIESIADLIDAISKLLSDLMVASEVSALPKRWITGLQIQEDEDGNPIDPFAGSDAKKMLHAEPVEARFGQFSNAQLDNYINAINLLIRQIAAIAALPDHYVGLGSAAPSSADAIRASEASLTARAEARQRTFGPSWARVGALVQAILAGGPVRRGVEVSWRDAGTRSLAQASDSAVKLWSAGLIGRRHALKLLGYGAEETDQIMQEPTKAEPNKSALTLPREENAA
jgi:hypothetical protein